MTSTTSNEIRTPAAGFELRFRSLFDAGRAFAFPCDARGVVDLDRLSERARSNYFLARACVGRDYAPPAIVAREPWLH
jgi:hypothetical protein